MATVAGAQAITATPSVVVAGAGSGGDFEVHIKNSGANPVGLGPASVTGSTGYQLATTEVIVLRISGDDTLYAASTAGSTLQVLAMGEVLGA